MPKDTMEKVNGSYFAEWENYFDFSTPCRISAQLVRNLVRHFLTSLECSKFGSGSAQFRSAIPADVSNFSVSTSLASYGVVSVLRGFEFVPI
jgi:hypothetical protein